MQISNGSEATVSPGQTSNGFDVLSGGQLFVTVSGTAEGTTIERGGVVQVLGGLTVGDTILGGEEMVYVGTAHVSSGGSTVVISGAGTAILSGGEQDVFGSAADTSVGAGGVLAVEAAVAQRMSP
jgi:autotransporter passenger strand-loop-strand repeat protein